MERDGKLTAEGLIGAARALRDAYPDAGAMERVEVGGPPGGAGDCPVRRALGYLRDEMLLVQAGRAGLWVLDDEVAHAEAALRAAGPAAPCRGTAASG